MRGPVRLASEMQLKSAPYSVRLGSGMLCGSCLALQPPVCLVCCGKARWMSFANKNCSRWSAVTALVAWRYPCIICSWG